MAKKVNVERFLTTDGKRLFVEERNAKIYDAKKVVSEFVDNITYSYQGESVVESGDKVAGMLIKMETELLEAIAVLKGKGGMRMTEEGEIAK